MPRARGVFSQASHVRPRHAEDLGCSSNPCQHCRAPCASSLPGHRPPGGLCPPDSGCGTASSSTTGMPSVDSLACLRPGLKCQAGGRAELCVGAPGSEPRLGSWKEGLVGLSSGRPRHQPAGQPHPRLQPRFACADLGKAIQPHGGSVASSVKWAHGSRPPWARGTWNGLAWGHYLHSSWPQFPHLHLGEITLGSLPGPVAIPASIPGWLG